MSIISSNCGSATAVTVPLMMVPSGLTSTNKPSSVIFSTLFSYGYSFVSSTGSGITFGVLYFLSYRLSSNFSSSSVSSLSFHTLSSLDAGTAVGSSSGYTSIHVPDSSSYTLGRCFLSNTDVLVSVVFYSSSTATYVITSLIGRSVCVTAGSSASLTRSLYSGHQFIDSDG